MTDSMSTFQDLGFFSEQLHQARASSNPEFASRFDKVLDQCKVSMAELRKWPNGEVHKGHAFARAFWWRCIETCQATVTLADLGMATSAMVTARAAHEYLYYACALWRKPGLYEKIFEKHDFELLKQLNEMERQQIWPESKTAPFRPPKTGLSGLSAKEAADAADLQDLYAVAYRGLSRLGAHSSLLSVIRAMPVCEKGGHSLVIGPDFEHTGSLLDNVNMCLITGGIRLHEAMDTLGLKASTNP